MGLPLYAIAVSFNNKGANVFSKGDFLGALTCFRAATKTFVEALTTSSCSGSSRDVAALHPRASMCLRVMRQHTSSPLSLRSSREGVVGAEERSTPTSEAVARDVSPIQQGEDITTPTVEETATASQAVDDRQENPSSISTNCVTILDSSMFVMSTRTVLIGEAKTNTRPSNMPEIASALMFNLALCYQMLSSSAEGERASRPTTYRLNALRFYKTAHTLRRRRSARNRTQQRQHEAKEWRPSMLDLSILNNTGLIFLQMGSMTKALKCFEQLALSLNQADVSKKNHAGFVKNLRILLPHCILAPAA